MSDVDQQPVVVVAHDTSVRDISSPERARWHVLVEQIRHRQRGFVHWRLSALDGSIWFCSLSYRNDSLSYRDGSIWFRSLSYCFDSLGFRLGRCDDCFSLHNGYDGFRTLWGCIDSLVAVVSSFGGLVFVRVSQTKLPVAFHRV